VTEIHQTKPQSLILMKKLKTKVMPAPKSARFFQIENHLNRVLDLAVAASMSLIK